jgi:hypothetical protein
MRNKRSGLLLLNRLLLIIRGNRNLIIKWLLLLDKWWSLHLRINLRVISRPPETKKSYITLNWSILLLQMRRKCILIHLHSGLHCSCCKLVSERHYILESLIDLEIVIKSIDLRWSILDDHICTKMMLLHLFLFFRVRFLIYLFFLLSHKLF